MFVSSVFEVSGFSGSPKEQSHTFKCSFFFFFPRLFREIGHEEQIHSLRRLVNGFSPSFSSFSPPALFPRRGQKRQEPIFHVFFVPFTPGQAPPDPRRTPRPLSHRHLFAERARATLCLLNIIGISARGLIKKQLPLAAAGGARPRAARLIWRMVLGERLARRTQRHAKLCLRT